MEEDTIFVKMWFELLFTQPTKDRKQVFNSSSKLWSKDQLKDNFDNFVLPVAPTDDSKQVVVFLLVHHFGWKTTLKKENERQHYIYF